MIDKLNSVFKAIVISYSLTLRSTVHTWMSHSIFRLVPLVNIDDFQKAGAQCILTCVQWERERESLFFLTELEQVPPCIPLVQISSGMPVPGSVSSEGHYITVILSYDSSGLKYMLGSHHNLISSFPPPVLLSFL